MLDLFLDKVLVPFPCYLELEIIKCFIREGCDKRCAQEDIVSTLAREKVSGSEHMSLVCAFV